MYGQVSKVTSFIYLAEYRNTSHNNNLNIFKKKFLQFCTTKQKILTCLYESSKLDKFEGF